MIEATLKPCPVCGAMPTISSTLLGQKYVMCPGHCETAGRNSAADAVALWNAGVFETSCTSDDPKQDDGKRRQQGWPTL